MTCAEFVEQVSGHLDGDLDPATTTEFEHHHANCPGCARYADQLRATVAWLSTCQTP